MFSLDLREIYFSMMLISAISSPVKIIANKVKVVITDEVGMPEMAARAGISPSITHGCLPTSATTHPASLHIHTSGMEIMATNCHHLLPSRKLRCL